MIRWRPCATRALTARGKKLLAQAEPLYIKEVKRIMAALKETEQKNMVAMLEKVRNNVSG